MFRIFLLLLCSLLCFGQNAYLNGVPVTITGFSGGGGGSLAGVRTASSSTDTVLTTDNGKEINYTYSGNVAVSLPQAGTSGFTNPYTVFFENSGTGVVTITPTTSTICSGSSLGVPPGQGLSIWADSTSNYQCNGILVLTDGTTLQSSNSGGVISLSAGPSTPTKLGVQQNAYNSVTVTSSGTNVITATCTYTCTTPVDKQSIWIKANYTSILSLQLDGGTVYNVYGSDGATTPLTTTSTNNYHLVFNASLNSSAGGWQVPSGPTGGGSSSYDVLIPWGTPYQYYGATPVFWNNQSSELGTGCNSAICYTSWNASGAGSTIIATGILPNSWASGAVKFEIFWSGNGSGNGGNPLQWKAQLGCYTNGSSSFGFNSYQTFPSQITVGSDYYIQNISMTTSGCAAGAPFQIQFSRVDAFGYAYIFDIQAEITVP